jgi:hypothetical protein
MFVQRLAKSARTIVLIPMAISMLTRDGVGKSVASSKPSQDSANTFVALDLTPTQCAEKRATHAAMLMPH